MKYKKSLFSLFAVLVFTLFLAACGGNNTANEEANNEEMNEEMNHEEEPMEDPTEEVMEEPMVDLSGVTITFWHSMSSGANLEGMDAMVADFNANNEWGITVEAIAQGRQSELETAVNGAITTGELPNMTMGFANGLTRWYSLGVIASLNDFIDDASHGLSADVLSGIYDAPYAAGTLADGTQVGIAMHQSAQVNFYNFTWGEELGFDGPPETAAEFKEQACAATEANNNDDDPDNDGTGGYVYFPSASTVFPFVWAFGGSVLNEAGDGYDLNNQAFVDVAVYLKDLVESGCTLSTPSFPNPEFAARQALFTTSSTAGIPFQRGAMEEVGNEDVWGAIPFVGPDGTKAVNAFGQMIGIVETNEDQDLASWLFLRWLTSPEGQASWISFTGYFPSQEGVDTGSRATDDTVWADALALLPYGFAEPNLPAHGAVRGEITSPFFAILDAADEAAIQAIMDELNQTAADIVAESE